MSGAGDQPDARELVLAVADLLRDAVLPAVEGALAFQVRVATNALSMAARELAAQREYAGAHQARLAALGVTDEHALARAVRDGQLDERYPDVLAALRQDVWERLAVVNPRYAAPYEDPETAAED